MMKQFYLIFLGMLFTWSAIGQSNDCSTAELVQQGTNSNPQAPYWYTYTAPDENTTVILSSLGQTTDDTYIYVYEDCDGGDGLNLIDRDDDSGDDYQSYLALSLQPNQTIKILWDDRYDSGPFDWTFQEVSIETNDCSTAETAQVGTNRSLGAPYWFSYTAPNEGDGTKLTVLSEGTTAEDTDLYIYEDCDGTNGLNLIDSNDDSDDNQSRLELFLNPNQTVKILWSDTNSQLPFDWTLQEQVLISINESDSLALVDFYNSTNGFSWRNNEGWTEPGSRVLDWAGVLVDGDRVKGIELNNNDLSGVLLASLGNLTELEYLRLGGNDISGIIPAEIGSLNNLKEFRVGANQFEGSVPESFADLSNLERLGLANNNLENLPDLSGLSNLQQFNVGGNFFHFDDLLPNFSLLGYYEDQRIGTEESLDFVSGESLTLSYEVGGSGNTYQWYKSGNPLAGQTSDMITLNSIDVSDVGTYQLVVDNPNASFSLSSAISFVSVDGNDPGFSCESAKLTNDPFRTNRTNTGGVTWFTFTSEASGSRYVEITAEGFTGPANLDTYLEIYSDCDSETPIAFNDDYNGRNESRAAVYLAPGETIKYKWENRENLDDFTFVVNSSGYQAADEADSLALVALYNETDGENWSNNRNWLEGPVDTWRGIELSSEGKVTRIELTNNGLTGNFPYSILELDQLIDLSISQNSFFGGTLSGTLPEDFDRLQNLEVIFLTGNDFEGALPASFANMPNLNTIVISGNNFESIPDLSGLTNLDDFEISDNRLTFEHMEPNIDVLTGDLRQRPFGDALTVDIVFGESEVISFALGGQNNSYQWERESSIVSNGNSSELLISDMNDSKAGDYVLKVTNSLFPDVELTSRPITVVKLKAEQIIDFDRLLEKKYTDLDFEIEASATSGLDVVFSSSDENVATISGTTVTIIGTGSTTLTATQDGNDDFNAAQAVERILTVRKSNQTINVTALADKDIADVPFIVDATTTSGLPLTYSILSGPASNTGNTITLDGTDGIVEVEVSQSGNNNFNPANPVKTQFIVTDPNKTVQTITFDALTTKTFGDSEFQLTATSSSNLEVTFESSDSDVLSISGNIATIVGAGTVNVLAKQAGDATFNPASIVSQELIIQKADQNIVISEISDKEVIDPSFDIEASVDSGLPLRFDAVGPVSINGKTISMTEAVGTVTVTVSQAGNANYNPASESVSFEVVNNRSDQTISITAIADKFTNAAPFAVEASTTSGLALTYALTGPATIEGNTITLEGSTGTVEVTVSQAGNENFNPATASISFEVIEDPCVDFAATATATNLNCAGSADGSITVETTEGTAPFTYSLEGAAAVESNEFTALEAGEYSIVVTDANGCSTSVTATIDSPDALEFSAEVENSNSINGNGSIALTVTGGTGEYSYSWSNGASTSSIAELGVGEYTVEVTDENGCSLEQSFTIGGVTANSEGLAEALLIFPNPAKDIVNLQHGEKIKSLKLYDARGKLLNEMATEGQGTELNVSQLPSGLYFIRQDGGSQLYRFVKE